MVGMSGHLQLLPSGFDEEWARQRLQETWTWADSTAPTGCWEWVQSRRPDYLTHLDRAFDEIDEGFHQKSMLQIEFGLRIFRQTVMGATAMHRGGDRGLETFGPDTETCYLPHPPVDS